VAIAVSFSPMGWIKWAGKALEFTGKIAQTDTFEEWLKGAGRGALERLAGEGDHKIFKELRAKRELWRDFSDRFETSKTFQVTLEAAVGNYPIRFAETVQNASDLPRRPDGTTQIVPRSVINKSEREFWQTLDTSQELANLKGGPELRAFFFDEMVRQLDQAFSTAAQRSSPNDPLQAKDRWVVGFDPNYDWAGVPGHYYDFTYYSRTSSDASRADKKEAKKKATEDLAETQEWLGKLDSPERQNLAAKL